MAHNPNCELSARTVTRTLKKAGLFRADHPTGSGFSTRSWAKYHNGKKHGIESVSVILSPGIWMQDIAAAMTIALDALTAAGFIVTQTDHRTINVKEGK